MRLWISVAISLAMLGCADGPTDVVDTSQPADRDQDGLTDEREEELGTDPDNPDTDNDGLTDGEEVETYLTDPLNPDYDNDGLLDGDEVERGTDPGNNDTDQDGLTDFEEVNNFGTDPLSEDTDGDTLTDEEELQGPTDPLLADTDGDGLGDEVELEGPTDPVDPDTDDDGLLDGEETITDPVDPDSDDDGLLDGDEIARGTDPLDEDTDNDFLPDAEEVDVGTDPTNPDTDGDGLTDFREVRFILSDPLDDDTDDDGLTDGEEVDTYSTSPLLTDTDADTLPDIDEINIHLTDPTSADPDADGLTDPRELTEQTDPFNPDSDGDLLLDGEEVDTYFTDPLDADTDDDELDDYNEVVVFGSDPFDTDSDDDGLLDGEEVNTYSTSPTSTDTDSDTLPDFDEINTTNTDPTSADPDNDGLTDPRELSEGTDPFVADSDADGLLDGEEVDIHSTDPLDDDSDDDGLNDAQEVVVYGSDPNVTDSDGDGLLDGDEVNTHGTSPTSADTDADTLTDFDEINTTNTDPTSADPDNDGLTDPRELAEGTDPFDDDSDDDGLLDGAEVDTHGTDPTVVDTDGDGLDDGDEVNIHPTDPTLADTDADGLNDGDEILVYFTAPLDPDTDDDGLDDGAEILAGADPFLPDSDFGGVPDGQEVNTDGTDPTDGSDDVCTYASVSLADASYVPPTPNFDPRFISFDWELVSNGNGVHDFFFDANNDGAVDAGEEISALLRLNLFGPEWDYLCQVEFEAEVATTVASPAWALISPDGTTSTTSLIEAMELIPTTAVTDCNALDSAVYGSDDIRTVLAGLDYGFGFGGLDQLASALEDEVIAAGEDWTNDWAPAVHGGWLTWDGTDAHLVNFGFVYDAVCGDVSLDADGDPLRQSGFDPFQPGQWSAGYAVAGADLAVTEATFGQTSFFDFEDVTGIACDRATATEGDASWTTGTNVLAATGVGFFVDLAAEGDGTVGDFRADLDADGTLEDVGATVTAVFTDAAGTEVCRIVYDADGATEVDPADWEVEDFAGDDADGQIDRAWTLTLADGLGDADCGTLDVANGWSDTDPEVVLEGTTFGFGIGALTAAMDDEGSTRFTDWADIDQDTFSVFITVDGTTAHEHVFSYFEDLDDCFEADLGVNHPPSWLSEGRAGRILTYGDSGPVATFVL